MLKAEGGPAPIDFSPVSAGKRAKSFRLGCFLKKTAVQGRQGHQKGAGKQHFPPQPNHILVTHADSVIVCGEDIGKQGKEILLREQSDKRGNSPQPHNGWRKAQKGLSKVSW